MAEQDGTSIDPNTIGAPPPAPSGFWANYGPAIATGAGLGGSMWLSRAAQNAAAQRSPEELAAINGATGPTGPGAVAGSLMSQSRPYITQPANYYQTLMNGNRAAMAQAVAPSRAALNESYAGAQADISRSGIRGAARDVLTGNLARDRAAKVAGLTTGVQPGAAAALAGLGQNLQAAAVPLYGQAQSFYQQMLQNGLQNRAYAAQEGDKTGQAMGRQISDLVNAITAPKGKKPTTTTPQQPTGPDYGSTTTVPEPTPNERVLTGQDGFKVPQPGVLGTGDYGEPDQYGWPGEQLNNSGWED